MLNRNGASDSRGRSTSETRAANGSENQRPRNLAHESKLVMQSNKNAENLATSAGSIATAEDDLEGHPVDPQSVVKKDDKSGGADYQNLTTDSNNSME